MSISDIFDKVDALLVISQKNRRYFTKFDSTFGYLVLTKDQKIFLTDNRYFEMAQTSLKDCKLICVGRGDVFDKLNNALKEVAAAKVGFEDTELTVEEFSSLNQKLGDFEFVPVGNLLSEIKKRKTEYEVQSVEKAQKITDISFLQVLNCIKEGMTEQQLSTQLQCIMLQNGAEKNSFDPIVSFGENTSKPHAHPTDRALKRGDAVLMDFGCIVNGYCSDMTRTVFFGAPNEKLKHVYDVVLEAQLAALSFVKADVSAKAAFEAANNVFEKHGLAKHFTHALGHGLGLDIHEAPSLSPQSNEILKENMFVTIEPGLYFPSLGGVRIEDLTLVTQHGARDLTTAPKDIIIIQ